MKAEFMPIDLKKYKIKCVSCKDKKAELFLSKMTSVCMTCYRVALAKIIERN